MQNNKEQLAKKLDAAAHQGSAISQISLDTEITLDEAYEIQALSIEERIGRGDDLVGYKLGFTSRAKMEQMGVHDIIWGRLTKTMHLTHQGSFNLSKFIHPRAEPEIAFRISKSIRGLISLNEVDSYYDAVSPAIEIIDSRFQNFKFSLEDVVADNCSSSAFVLGTWMEDPVDVSNLSLQIHNQDGILHSGTTKAILGNPLESIIELSKMTEKYGFEVEPGQIVLAGAATPAEYLKNGDRIHADFETLGRVGFTVV